MKKIIVQLSIILIFILTIATIIFYLAKEKQMVVVYEGNLEQKPIEIKLGHFQDSDCGMVIEDKSYASEVISKDGKTWFFHDHGGMAHWLNSKSFKESAKIFVFTKDTKRWIDGRKAWYSLTDKTPMNYGFGAYEKKQDGFIDFKTMSIKMARGENLTNPRVRRELLKNGERWKSIMQKE